MSSLAGKPHTRKHGRVARCQTHTTPPHNDSRPLTSDVSYSAVGVLPTAEHSKHATPLPVALHVPLHMCMALQSIMRACFVAW